MDAADANKLPSLTNCAGWPVAPTFTLSDVANARTVDAAPMHWLCLTISLKSFWKFQSHCDAVLRA